MNQASRTVFQLRGVSKVWGTSGEGFQLSIPQLELCAGDRIALLGQSGCGKSTLLDILAMTLQPTACENFRFAPHDDGQGTDIGEAWTRGRLDLIAGLRGRYIGYVLQTGGLLPFISVRDNIALPRQVCGMREDGSTEDLAERLLIADQLDKLPATLSVGQRQRVAVARALAHAPEVILADEPTASLDPHTASEVMGLLVELASQRGVTLVVASHDWDGVTSLGLKKLHHEQMEEDGVLKSEFHS